ncbi:MAG: hypothetical protein H0T46_34100 [Deltaproteobacteria bacterium]|nr:hypothetical protein [Deltaproteobacteria bacterium]
MYTRALFLILAAGCDLMKPRVADQTIDAPTGPLPDAPPDSAGAVHVLPPGASVPPITENAELTSQIRIFDGLSDSALAMAGGVIVRSTGKAAGATVRFWNFGAARIIDNFVASSPVYVLADSDGAGGFTPRAGHPFLVDALPGDPGYSAIRRIVYVPVTALYQGERLTSVPALAEAIELGLVGEPVPAGTWRNMPVVPTGTKLEVSTTLPAVPATEAYARGYRIELIPLGGALGIQPLRNGSPFAAQEARLLSGVATGTPPSLPTTLDAQPVFQLGIPTMPPTTTPNYTPIVIEVDVRLAAGVDPVTVLSDAQLFRRATNGSISAYFTDTVSELTVTTIASNKQIQFVDGEP